MSSLGLDSRQKKSALIIGYNRPDLLERQLQEVLRERDEVFIFIDGPKSKDDQRAIEAAKMARDITQEKKAATTKVHLKVAQSNLGCRMSIPTAINWAFESTESLIVLEDDISATSEFFEFMDFALEKYRDHQNIYQINGWAPVPTSSNYPPVFLSRHAFCWGWGTWKSKWQRMNLELDGLDVLKSLDDVIVNQGFNTNGTFKKIWRQRLLDCKNGKDTWDFQWYLSIWMNHGWSLALRDPLTSNLGFDEFATRTRLVPKFLKDTPLVKKHANSSLIEINRYLNENEVKHFPLIDFLFDQILLNRKTCKGLNSILFNMIVGAKSKLRSIG